MLKNHRMLIATIKDFGARPCPRCLVSVDQICAVGREDDWKWCKESCCQDNAEWGKKVDNAHKSLYDNGYAITGDHIDGLLKDESLVPTKVFMSVFACSWSQCHSYRMHSQWSSRRLASISTWCWLLTSYMRWNLAYGRHCSRTLSGCSTRVGQIRSTSLMNGVHYAEYV